MLINSPSRILAQSISQKSTVKRRKNVHFWSPDVNQNFWWVVMWPVVLSFYCRFSVNSFESWWWLWSILKMTRLAAKLYRCQKRESQSVQSVKTNVTSCGSWWHDHFIRNANWYLVIELFNYVTSASADWHMSLIKLSSSLSSHWQMQINALDNSISHRLL